MSPAKVLMVSIYIPENGNVGFLTCIRDNTIFIQEIFPHSKLDGRIKEGDTILGVNRFVVGVQITCKQAVQILNEAEYRVDVVVATEPDTFPTPFSNNQMVEVRTPLRSESALPFVEQSPEMPILTPNHSTLKSVEVEVDNPPPLTPEINEQRKLSPSKRLRTESFGTSSNSDHNCNLPPTNANERDNPFSVACSDVSHNSGPSGIPNELLECVNDTANLPVPVWKPPDKTAETLTSASFSPDKSIHSTSKCAPVSTDRDSSFDDLVRHIASLPSQKDQSSSSVPVLQTSQIKHLSNDDASSLETERSDYDNDLGGVDYDDPDEDYPRNLPQKNVPCYSKDTSSLAESNASYSLTLPRKKEDRSFWCEYLGTKIEIIFWKKIKS